jgi:hypothetical protein
MSQDSFVTEYLFLPIIIFLVIILIYSYIKKKLLRDDREDLESLKLLQELRDSGTINENEFEKKRIVLLQNGETLKNKLNTYSSSSSPYFFFLLLFLEIITKVKLFMGGVNVVIMFGKDLEIKKLTQNIQVM